MVKITFSNVIMSEKQIEALRLHFNKLYNDDLHYIPDTMINGFFFASDEELHIKPIYECKEIKTALELTRIALSSHCNTKTDEIVLRRYEK